MFNDSLNSPMRFERTQRGYKLTNPLLLFGSLILMVFAWKSGILSAVILGTLLKVLSRRND